MDRIWNLKDLLPVHKGVEFEKIIADLKLKVSLFEKKRSMLRDDISCRDFNALLNELECVDLVAGRVSAFGDLWFSENTGCEDARAFVAKMEQLSAELANKTLFFSLWWKKIGDSVADRLLAGAGKNKYFLEHLRKLRMHSLEENEEKIINLKDLSGVEAFNKLYDLITSSFRFPLTVKGEIKSLSVSELLVYIKGSDARLRENAYKSLWAVYKNNSAVLGEIYFSVVRDWNNECLKLRGYSSPINVRNKSNDLPDAAIDALLEACRENRCLFQEFFKLKGELLGLKKMSRYHIYAPLEKDDKKIPFDAAVKIVLDNFGKFSPEISALAKKVFDAKHVHSALGKNKRSGAFCYGVSPKEVPYVLLNYTETSDDVVTLAHELGHAVHDLLASNNTVFTFQPPLPLAETASVFGELIVTHALLKTEKNKKMKRHLIAGKLDDIYATVLRQTYFILFEKLAHKRIPEGVTLKEMCDEYRAGLREQFGDIAVSEDFSYEWLYIPHIFHTPFYCYAYSFGNLLVLSLYKMYLDEGESFIPKYLKLLSYGGSRNPEQILNELGIDIRKKDFWKKGFDVIREMLDEFKSLI